MRNVVEYTLLDAKGATGVDKVIDVSDFRHAVISYATDGGADANLTVKICGSIEDTAPTFTDAQSVTNMYDFVQVKDLEDGSSIDGDTGIAVAGADDYRQFEVNINGLKWLTARVTARSAGEISVKIKLFTNQ